MNILALDTSGPVCSVAVMKDSRLVYEARAVNAKTHSRNLMPMVDEALNKSGCQKNELHYIAAVLGPGSFTGVRIGVAAAQGMARGLGIKCIGVNALSAMAESISVRDVLVCPIRDARAQQVYGAAFQNGQRLMEDSAMKLTEFIEAILKLGKQYYFLGDGALVHEDMILEVLGNKAIIAPPHLIQPGAGAAAVLASRLSTEAVQPHLLNPIYLRAPQAERLKAQQDANNQHP